MGLFNTLLFRNYFPGDCHKSNTCYQHFYSLALETDFSADSDIIMADATLPQDVEMHDEARDTLGPLPEIHRRFRGREITSAQEPDRPPTFVVEEQVHDRRGQSLPTKVQRTPSKPSVGAIETDDGIRDPEFKAFIETEFKKHVIRDYPIIDFIDHVWNVHPSQIPAGDFELARMPLKQYLAAGRYSKESKFRELGETGAPLIGLAERAETRACVAFQELFQDMAKIVMERWREEDPVAADEIEGSRFQGTLRFLHEKIVKWNYANFKPDFGYVTEGGENTDAIAWDAFGLFGELKTDDTIGQQLGNTRVDQSLLDVQKEQPYTPSPPRKSRKRSKPDTPVEEGPSSKQRRSNQSDSVPTNKSKPNECVSKPPATAKLTPQESALLRFNQDEDEDCSEFTNNEIQAAKYLNELLSHGARNYATGFLVENEKISLWYGDRFGIIKSRLFNFIEEPHYFLLMVTAIIRASDEDLGFCPLIRNVPRNHLSHKGATLMVPAARDVNDKCIGKVEFKTAITEAKSIVTAYGTVGRGTTVIPITSIGKKNCKRFGKGRLVAKVSWQPVERYEEGHIRAVRKALKKSKDKAVRAALAYIVDLKCSSTLAINDPNVNLPRAFMTQLPGIPEDERRNFRILVLKEYFPLQFIDTSEELKKVFRDVVNGHYWAWTVAEVLHRDISISNVMFHRKAGRAIGVLCDWDLAETKKYLGEEPELTVDIGEYEAVRDLYKTMPQRRVTDHEPRTSGPDVSTQVLASPVNPTEQSDTEPAGNEDEDDESARRRKAKYRTGTGPFMAMDLFAPGSAPTHLYRHDLESFFWVLVWFVATHNPSAHTLGRMNQWQGSDLRSVYSAKVNFLKKVSVARRVLSKRHLQYDAMWKETLNPLKKIFHRVEHKASALEVLQPDYIDAYLEGDIAEMQDIGKEIVREARERNALVSYEIFVSNL
ncbi:unnamed protein product [Somion occarium]|uniref:Fungal-type protein kinase domain-containing protein n=1 Tax=Somion occarium TaxID=3059160 RepID=A0ABP1CUH9_9APHY